MGDLLNAARDTGSKIATAELPAAGELPEVLGGLIAHLEQHVPDVNSIDLANVPGLHPEAEPEAPPAGEPPTPAPAPAPGEPPAPAPDADDEAAEAAKLAELEATVAADSEQIATLRAELATALGSKPPDIGSQPTTTEQPPAP